MRHTTRSIVVPNRLQRGFQVCRDFMTPPDSRGIGSTPWLSLEAVRPARAGVLAMHGPYNLALDAGERAAILGPSGAGKSTLLKLLSGDLPPLSGRLCLAGASPRSRRPAELARLRAVLPQGHGVAFGMHVELVVGLGRAAIDRDPHRQVIVSEALSHTRAAHLWGRRFDTLSGGEQARVQLARVLAQLWDVERGLLLLDEPLAALDPGLQFELMDAIQSFIASRGHGLVAVVHDLNHALQGFDRLWLLRDGQLFADLPAGVEAIGPLSRLYGIALQAVSTPHGRLAVIAAPAASAAPL
jgi:iron complex transport system ATP-binding protein